MSLKRGRASKDTQTMKKRRAVGGAYIPVRSPNKRPYQKVQSLPANFQPTGAEIKAIDIANVAQAFRSPAIGTGIVLLNGVQAGTGFFNRVGARIEMKNLHLRGTVENQTTSTTGADLLRILIIYDRQPTGALPVIADILQTRTQTGAATTSGSSEINLDNRDRFTILRDMQFYGAPVTNTAGVLTNGPQYPGETARYDINEFIKLRGLACHFKSTSNPATIADIATGALYSVFTTDGGDALWTTNISYRMRFDDK